MIGAALLLTAMLAAGGRPPPADAFARAVALQQAGDREGAAAAYRAFLEAHPSTSRRGRTSASCSRSSGATRRRSRPIAPRSPSTRSSTKVRLNLGIALYKAAQLRRRRHRAGGRARRAARQPAGALSRGRLPAPDGRAEDGHRAARADRAAAPGRPRARLHARHGLSARRRTSTKGGVLVDRILKRGESARGAPDDGDGQARRAGSRRRPRGSGRRWRSNPELPGVHCAVRPRAARDRQPRSRPGRVRGRAAAQPARLRRAPLSRRAAEGGRSSTTRRWRTSSAPSASGPAISACATRS